METIYKKLKYYFDNYLQKAQYNFDNSYKKLNIILATFTKTPILFWQLLQKAQYYFGNFILESSIKKTQNYWANNYSTKAQILFGKRIILCSKPKTILWQKHILIY